MMKDFAIFAGTAVPDLAAAIAHELGLRLGPCAVERFPDGETWVGLDEPVRGRDVFLVQSTSPPINESLMELLAFVDACRRASAARITAIVPYFGYARQDKRAGRREPITASMVAAMFEAVGVNHVVTIDLHTPQIEAHGEQASTNETGLLRAAPELYLIVGSRSFKIRAPRIELCLKG
jgi:ribose-phosphate pyrophosphokinase